MNAKKEWGCLIRKKVFALQGENGFFRRDRDKLLAPEKKTPKLNMRNANTYLAMAKKSGVVSYEKKFLYCKVKTAFLGVTMTSDRQPEKKTT